MSATLTDVRYEVLEDVDPDASYLEQDEFADRLAEYRAGEFSFVGVRAVAELTIKTAAGSILKTIASPGLWGIESDSGDEYLVEVGREEAETLRDMLAELGVQWDAADLPQQVTYR